MGATRYRAAAPETLVSVALDELVALYHRPSGITHLLAEPAPAILAALAAAALTTDELLSTLDEHFALHTRDAAALQARVDELIDAGLVARA